jgi:hypothetical protein
MLRLSKTILMASFIFTSLFLLEGVAISQPIPFETIDKGEISYFNYGDPNFWGADMVIREKKHGSGSGNCIPREFSRLLPSPRSILARRWFLSPCWAIRPLEVDQVSK